MPTPRNTGATSTKNMGTTASEKSSSVQRDIGQSLDKTSVKTHKRSRSGCFTCRLRRKKCDEGHPTCKACTNLCVKCEYKRPMWWGNPEQRRLQKERIKNKIKQTKSLERSNTTQDNINRIHLTVPSPSPQGPDFYHPFFEPYEPFGPHFATPGFVPISYGHYAPYEIDVRTERQTFVNDVPLRQDSSVSTFSSMGPPQLHATLPTFPAEEGLQAVYLDSSRADPDVEPTPCFQGVGQSYDTHHATITVYDYDRPLLDHFVQNVLRMTFPILEVHQQGSARAGAVLDSLATNVSYFHCCLSVAAIHLKTTSEPNGNQYDDAIMRHRVAVIGQLNAELEAGTNLEHILDTTLAMILFPCSVGVPDGNRPDEKLPDVPWSAHFEAVSDLVKNLGLNKSLVPCDNRYMVAPFKMSLTSWIDILGSTMLGRVPQFIKDYRMKHDNGISSGLKELMGCDDRVMYLIAEIACLEGRMNQGPVNEDEKRKAFFGLEEQLDHIESENPKLENPYSMATGPIRPDVLTKNITRVFLLAARIHLRSLAPGADRDQGSICSLVDAIAETLSFVAKHDELSFIPAGPSGFDCSLVWPLFIAGIFSKPESHFRKVLNARLDAMNGLGGFGNLGRMYQLLIEYWLSVGDPVDVAETMQPFLPKTSCSATQSKTGFPPLPPLQSPGMREIKKQKLHWRDVMSQNKWCYLLI